MDCSLRTARLTVLCLIATLAPALGLDAATPALFKLLDHAPAAPLTKKTQRARVVGMDSQNLIRQATDADSTIRFNLFADASADGVIESTRIDGAQGFVSRGRIVWSEVSSFLFVVRGDAVAGIVSIADKRFRVVSLPGAPGQVVVSELIPPQMPDCACGKEHAVVSPAAERPATAAADGSTIDVLVAYTQSALTAVGGAAQMDALIQLAIEESNANYQASNVTQRLRLVHKVQTNYNESSGFDPALNALTNPSDGKMDELHVLRNQYGADMVSLLINNSQYCGLAWLMSNESHAFESMAFSVVHYDCATGYFSFSHELGHNSGLNHDRANAGSGGVAPYAYGWRWVGNGGTTWRSVMAYAPGTRVGRFSNPDVLFDGVATGTATDNNARALNDTYDTVANFRASILPGTPIITSPLTASGQPNQPFSYQIVATNSPTSFNATGLPAGLSVNTSNGLISGTPTQTGQFNVTLSATNAVATGELVIKLTIGSTGCGARTLVELNNALKILSPVRLGQLDEALPTLRTLRDKVLMPHPAGKKLVESYYAQGPAVSRVLVDHEPLARQALPLLIELLPQLQEGTRAEGRYQLSRDQYDRVLKLFDAVEQVSAPELKLWLAEVRQLMTRAQRDASEEQIVLEIAQALQEP